MCSNCHSGNLNRRKFIGRTIKASGAASLILGGYSFIDPGSGYEGTVSGELPLKLPELRKEPAMILVVFLYPPAEVVIAGKNEDSWAKDNWFTWPGNQFEPEIQEKVFRTKISSIAEKLGVKIDFAPKAIYQKVKVDEFINEAKIKKPDAVLIVNFWNTFEQWSFEMATQSAPAAIVYQPVGSNHQLPPSDLMNTKGIYYIHSIENWDEIERGFIAVRAKKMLSQSRLLRVSDQDKAMVRDTEKFLNIDIAGISAAEFNNMFDSIEADQKIKEQAMDIKRRATEVMGVEDFYFTEAIRSHYAVSKIMEQYGADAITIQCLMLKHRKPCLSFSLNNGNLIPCGCENALDGTITQMIGRWLFERAGFMHNPEFDTSENLYFGAHCTCATKLHGTDGSEQKYLVRPFFHQLPKTAALDVQWEPWEPVMLVKYFTETNSIGCWTGKIVESPKSPPTGGCATRVLVNMDNVENIADTYLGPHPILFCGNRKDARKLKAFTKLYGIDLKGNI